MKCVQCGSFDTDVKDSRPTMVHGPGVRRRRCCRKCGLRFTTFELTEEQIQSLTIATPTDSAVKKMEEAIYLLQNPAKPPMTEEPQETA